MVALFKKFLELMFSVGGVGLLGALALPASDPDRGLFAESQL